MIKCIREQVEQYVGNGACRLQTWSLNEKLVLQRNPTYWDNGHTSIEEVTYLPINSAHADIAHYQTDAVDITRRVIPAEYFKHWQRECPQELYISPSWSIYYYAFNPSNPLY